MFNKTVKRDYCRNRQRRRSEWSLTEFTLIEVTMAIAVIAVGMVGVMALFPVGLQASRNAVGDNYSSVLARQILQMVALQAKIYEGDGQGAGEDGWGAYITGDAANAGGIVQIPSSKASGSSASDPLGVNNFTGSGKPDKSDPFLGNPELGIYNIDKANGVYYLESKSGDIVDFSAAVAVWQGYTTYDSDGDGNPDDIVETAGQPSKYAARLFLEISWPINAPYDKRTKRYYMLDVFNDIPR